MASYASVYPGAFVSTPYFQVYGNGSMQQKRLSSLDGTEWKEESRGIGVAAAPTWVNNRVQIQG
jgi:hypothetical protein